MYLKRFEIKDSQENVFSMEETLSDEGFEYVDDIVDDLKYAYENNHEDYLMNLLNDESLKELLEISKNWNIFHDDYRFRGDNS